MTQSSRRIFLKCGLGARPVMPCGDAINLFINDPDLRFRASAKEIAIA
jgi:hypothetical protein